MQRNHHHTRACAVWRAALSSLIATAIPCAEADAQAVWYVDMTAAANGTGTSWGSAFDTLQQAIDAAQAGDEIWVAAGVYCPAVPSAPADPRSASFVLPHDVAIYGGFAGHEQSVATRAGLFDVTILCGDIGVAGDRTDNCYHVVTLNGTTQYVAATLDGFTVRDGYGLGGALSPSRGAGITVRLAGGTHTPTLFVRNCTIRDNVADIGGGIAVTNLGAVQIAESTLTRNSAVERGGAVFVQTAFFQSVNTSWSNNHAGNRGGGLYVNSTSNAMVRLANDVLWANQANEGGGIYVAGGQFTNGTVSAYNCTFGFNSAGSGVSIFADTAAATQARLNLHNSVLWHDPQSGPATLVGSGATMNVTHSCVLGGFAGLGNIASDPLFLDGPGGNLRLRSSSPCNDSGDNGRLPPDYGDVDGDGDFVETLPLDKDRGRRLTDDPVAPNTGVGVPPVDMGAYEY
ncbi:MAG: DUF1565 domain-containing protein [Planctomycetes bacterium]|nr:DUF1565 domain-containing protein [Planctomycetota bacterium]